MKFIDSQMHCFYPNTPQRPWPDGAKSNHHGPKFEFEEALDLMDRNGIHRTILVPPGWNGWDNDYSLSAARKMPDRFAVMGRFDFRTPDAEERLKGWRDQKGMLGIRVPFIGEPFLQLLTDRTYDWFWRTVEETRLPIMSMIPSNIKGFEPILERFPNLRLIVDHAGRHTTNGVKDHPLWADVNQLYALARYPNVAVKLSSFPSFSTQAYPFKNLHKHISNIQDHFGPRKMLWGSDVTRLTSSYEENIRLFTEALDFLNDEDKEWIMGRAAAQCCDWPL